MTPASCTNGVTRDVRCRTSNVTSVVARTPARRRPVHNGPVSLSTRLVLVCAALLGGCAWDGPTPAVRVVTDGTVVGDTTSDALEPGGSGGGEAGAATDATSDAHGMPNGNGQPSNGDDPDDPDGRDDRDDPDDADVDDNGIVPPFPRTVAVVGDSLTLSAQDEIAAELAGLGLEVLVVDGVESRRMTVGSSGRPSGLEAIRTIRAEFDDDPDLWVVALGTNDVAAQIDEERFRDDLRGALAGVQSDAPVVWVDIWIRDRREAVVAANRVIRDELAGRDAPSGVVGWFAHGGADGLVTADGVHLTERGQVAFATAIGNQVRSIYHR
jgi:lysophospholipase L1-like esterase